MADTFLLIPSPLVGPYSWIPAQAELQARGQRGIGPSLLAVLSRKSGFAPAITAAARPMFSPGGWITESPARESFRAFIAKARTRAGYG